MMKITANLRNKGIKTTWRRENILILFLFITFIHINVGMDTICNVRIDVIESLTMDGFLRNNHVLSQWFHEKYPTCTLYNYKEKDRIIIGDEENDLDDNVKVHNHYNKNTNNQESIHRHIMDEDVDFNDGDNYNSKAMNNLKTKKDTSYQRYNDHNDVADEVNSKRFLKLNNDVGNVNGERVSNDVLHLDEKNVVFDNRIDIGNNKGRDLEERRLRNDIGRSLVSEWHEGLRSGTYILLHDVNITSTVNVEEGKALEITGIVGVDGIRPAIDGGGTPGCRSNCRGYRVFEVDGSYTKLILTNLTIKNGWVCRYIYISLSDHFSIMVFFMYQSNY